jgi:hypothetical protein
MIGRFGATATEGNLISAWDHFNEQFSDFDFQVDDAGTDEINRLSDLMHSIANGGIAMPEDVCSKATVVVGVPLTFDIDEEWTVGFSERYREAQPPTWTEVSTGHYPLSTFN